MFCSVAYTWWRTVEATYRALVDDVGWDTFKTAFTKHFIPNHVWVQKLAEFEQLTLGTMTVQQYKIRFKGSHTQDPTGCGEHQTIDI